MRTHIVEFKYINWLKIRDLERGYYAKCLSAVV